MKSFISKLNDRNLQRKRESGITSYVLFSVLILCLYKLFSHSELLLKESVYSPENLPPSIWLICFVFHLLFSLGALSYIIFPVNKIFNTIKLIKNEKTESYIFLSMILSFPISLILITYTYLTNPSTSILLKFYFYFILIFSLIGIFLIFVLYRNSKKENLLINSENNTLKKIVSIATYFIITIISICSIILIYSIQVDYKTEIIKLTILIYLSYAIIERILQNNSFDSYYLKLEDFEYETVLRDLDENQIRKEFQKRFSGFMISDWVLYQTAEFSDRIKTYQEDLNFYNNIIIEQEKRYVNGKNDINFIQFENSVEQRKKLVKLLFIDQNTKQITLLRNTINANYQHLSENERSRIYNLISEISNIK